MNILASGSITNDLEKTLVDLININMNLDINDVPLANYGIIQNFSKSTIRDSLLVLRVMILDFLDEYMMDMIELEDIQYINNKFVVIFSYSGKQIQVNIDE